MGDPGRRIKLDYERTLVAIHNQPRPAITLTVNPAVTCRVIFEEPRSSSHGPPQSIPPPVAVNLGRLTDVQDPHPQRRVWIEKAHGQETIMPIIDDCQLPKVALMV